MAKKYDTNPLDPGFPERARTKFAEPAAAPQSPFKTAEFPGASPPGITEDETRRFSEADFNASAFQGISAPAAHHPRRFADMNAASSRKVTKVGVSEKWLIGLPYLPFYVGLAAGIVLLLLVPKEETKVRFHAAQGLAAHLAILIITKALGLFGGLADLAGFIFWVVTAIMLIVFAVKAWTGKPVHIEPVDDLTNWLEEKLGPIN